MISNSWPCDCLFFQMAAVAPEKQSYAAWRFPLLFSVSLGMSAKAVPPAELVPAGRKGLNKISEGVVTA